MNEPSLSALALSRPQRSRRSYDDGCAAAHALDLVGDRWALLVVRELLLGPRRFSDLRHALRGISPNVLTQRLGDLEAGGVLRRDTLPPPASCHVYRLTAWGRELETAILALLKWGVRSPAFRRGQPLTADAMALSFKAMFNPALAGTFECRLTLFMDEHAYHVEVCEGRLSVTRGVPPCAPAEAPAWADATLHAAPVAVLRMAYGGRALPTVLASGDCRAEGDTGTLERFLACFRVPAPLASDEPR